MPVALSSSGNLVPVRVSACTDRSRPSLVGGRLFSLSVSSICAHPCNPGAHMELPWRAADALCSLPARRLLRHLRPEGRPDPPLPTTPRRCGGGESALWSVAVRCDLARIVQSRPDSR